MPVLEGVRGVQEALILLSIAVWTTLERIIHLHCLCVGLLLWCVSKCMPFIAVDLWSGRIQEQCEKMDEQHTPLSKQQLVQLVRSLILVEQVINSTFF